MTYTNPLRDPQDRRLPRIAGPSGMVLFGVTGDLSRQRLREKYAVIWVVVVAATLTLPIFPGVLSWAADLLGVQVPSNLLFFGAIMLLLVISIQLSYEIGRLEERTRTLAEEVALLRLQDESHRGDRGSHGTHGPDDGAHGAPDVPEEPGTKP